MSYFKLPSHNIRLFLHRILKNLCFALLETLWTRFIILGNQEKCFKNALQIAVLSRNASTLSLFYIQLFNFKITFNNFDNKFYKSNIRFYTTFFKVVNKFFKCRISSWNCGGFADISASDCGFINLQKTEK